MANGIKVGHSLAELLPYLLEDGFNGVELRSVGRDVVDFSVFFDEHTRDSGQILAVVSVDGIHICDNVQLFVPSLNILAEGTLPQVDQELRQDVMKPLSGDEAVLKVKVEHAVYGTGDQDRDGCFFLFVGLPKAAAHLVDVYQGLLSHEERSHDLCIGFPDTFELGLVRDGGVRHVLVAVPHLPQVSGHNRPRDLYVVVGLNVVGHLHRRVELLILQDLLDDLFYLNGLAILPLLLQRGD